MKPLRAFLIVVGFVLTTPFTHPVGSVGAAEAPTGFDNLTNGFIPQDGLPCLAVTFACAKLVFEDRVQIANGLGPVYDAQSCAECHQNPVTGGISQINTLKAGHFDRVTRIFIPHPGGIDIQARATDPLIQERVLPGNEVQTFRTSLNLLGDGFVEAIDDATLLGIQASQPLDMRGDAIMVTVNETGVTRVGRFGWKDQGASLITFTASAYRSTMGVTSPLFFTELTSNGNSVGPGGLCGVDPCPGFSAVAEDTGGVLGLPNCTAHDPAGTGCGKFVEAFVQFIRATKAPPRGPCDADCMAGDALFDAIGCNVCHVRTITTAPPGTPINVGGMPTVPAALGNQTIHPFSDFLLHDVGTGDGIVQDSAPQSTRNKLRTPPLWGVRTRNRLMHDGKSLTFKDAIRRHKRQAAPARRAFLGLDAAERGQLIKFLESL
ncbi:MAG: hypothetical protein HYY11_02020 [Candidatus Methylomirabilis oxyfera]|nr:hypothetical protein [Candidatus Methylomirabilis oxyfera]